MGEITQSDHVVKAKDVHIADNKDKLRLVLYSSKTHNPGMRPQKISITSNRIEKSGNYLKRHFCPFQLVKKYNTWRGSYDTDTEQFFVFRDKSPVTAENSRKILKTVLVNLGLNPAHYGMHSFRIGRTSDLIKYNYSIEEVKKLGRWHSNVVYKYIRQM